MGRKGPRPFLPNVERPECLASVAVNAGMIAASLSVADSLVVWYVLAAAVHR